MKPPFIATRSGRQNPDLSAKNNLHSHTGSRKSGKFFLYAALTLTASLLGACKKDQGPTNPASNNFPVNQDIEAQLVAKGVPADAAQFFAAAKVETDSLDDTTLVCKQTFPNGATRDITFRVSPNTNYTPTADDISRIPPGGMPVYNCKFSSTVEPDSSTRIEMSYFVAKAGLPKRMSVFGRTVSIADGGEGAGIQWSEIGNKGYDVTIGSVIEYFNNEGKIGTGPLGSIYQLASAVSDVSTAMELSQQTTDWMNKLKALENCAMNPTNQVARSDPNYVRDATSKVQAAESEMQQVTAVRFLNIMTETAAQLNPVTNVMAVGMKQGFAWSEQTLKDYSENTIMREMNLLVVPCDNTPPVTGNIDVVWECTSTFEGTVDHTVIHTITNVAWTYNTQNGLYEPKGEYNFTYTRTVGGCTEKKTAIGNIDGTGSLIVISDLQSQNQLGYSYLASGNLDAQVAATYSCPPSSGPETYTVKWLPLIKGPPGATDYSGKIVNPSCGGSGGATGTETITWDFSVPPK